MPSLHAKESKALLVSGFHALNSGFHVLYMFFVGGSCCLDSNRWWDSAGFHKKNVVAFRILQAKIRKAGIRIPLHGAIHFIATAFNRTLS